MKRLLIIFASMIMIASVVYAGTIENASETQRNLIQSALGDQYPISKIAVIKSGNHNKAYYVGAIFHAKGIGDVFGIWFLGGDKNKPNLVYSVNGAAHQFSGMRKASETEARAYIHDQESKALMKYFGK